MAATKGTKSTVVRVGQKSAGAAAGLVRTLSDPKKTRRLLTAGKVVAPIIAPLALRAVDLTRLVVDQRRARALGVDVADVGDCRGPTGRTKARIDAVAQAARQLRDRHSGDAEVVSLTDRVNQNLADLSTAIDTAAPMPAARRRPTLLAVQRELDRLETELISHLVRPLPPAG